MSPQVDLRCPVDSRRLFAKVLSEGTVTEGNTIEFVCIDCRKQRRRNGQDVERVLHEFNLLGQCVGTKVQGST